MLDVLITGGGANGLTLALALCKYTSLKVGIVELNAYQRQPNHPGFDARVIALANASQQLLQQLGLCDLTAYAQPIEKIHVSDASHLGQCQLAHQDYQLDALGHVVELSLLGQKLKQQLETFSDARLSWFCPDSVSAIEQYQQHHQVTLASGQVLKTKLIAVTEGANSPTRARLNLGCTEQHYAQSAVIANVAIDRPHNSIAYERFTESGPLALLPMQSTLGAGTFSLVWSLPPEQVDDYLQMDASVFLSELQRAFGYRAGRFVQLSERASYPLSLLQANDDVSHRAVLLGNCAQSLHPIAGQGLNLGLRDVYGLFQCLKAAEQAHQDIGAFAVLNRYQTCREQDKQSTVRLTDGLVKLFSNQYLATVAGRNLGLLAMQLMPFAKTHFAMQATGLTAMNKLMASEYATL